MKKYQIIYADLKRVWGEITWKLFWIYPDRLQILSDRISWQLTGKRKHKKRIEQLKREGNWYD